MNPGSDDRRIIEEAAQWFERARHGSADDRLAFRAWLQACPEHVAAMDLVERAARRAPDAARWAKLRATTRYRRLFEWPSWSWPAFGTALAGICAMVAWNGSVRDQRIAAAPDGVAAATLADGSRVWLTAGSSLTAHITPIGRAVSLTGEGVFDVPHQWRPFAVTAGNVRVIDRGTLFSVARHDDRVTVVLARGAVDVADRQSGAMIASPRPNQQVVIARNHATVSPIDADAALAWRERRIVAADLPFSAVAARFAELGGASIRVMDPTLGALRVYGTYRAQDAESFLNAMKALYPIEWRRTKDGYEVRRR